MSKINNLPTSKRAPPGMRDQSVSQCAAVSFVASPPLSLQGEVSTFLVRCIVGSTRLDIIRGSRKSRESKQKPIHRKRRAGNCKQKEGEQKSRTPSERHVGLVKSIAPASRGRGRPYAQCRRRSHIGPRQQHLPSPVGSPPCRSKVFSQQRAHRRASPYPRGQANHEVGLQAPSVGRDAASRLVPRRDGHARAR